MPSSHANSNCVKPSSCLRSRSMRPDLLSTVTIISNYACSINCLQIFSNSRNRRFSLSVQFCRCTEIAAMYGSKACGTVEDKRASADTPKSRVRRTSASKLIVFRPFSMRLRCSSEHPIAKASSACVSLRYFRLSEMILHTALFYHRTEFVMIIRSWHTIIAPFPVSGSMPYFSDNSNYFTYLF